MSAYPSAPSLSPLSESLAAPTGWLSIFKDAMAYPCRGNGALILLPGAALGLWMLLGSIAGLQHFLFPLSLGQHLGEYLPHPVLSHTSEGYSIVGHQDGLPQQRLTLVLWLVPLAFGLAACATYYLRVIEGTIAGISEAPHWPSRSDVLEDLAGPLTVLGAGVLSALPVLAYHVAFPRAEEFTPVTLALDWMGAAFFTLAVLAYASYGSVRHGLQPALRQFLSSSTWAALVLPASLLFVIRLLAHDLFVNPALESGVGIPLGCLLTAWFIPIHGRLMGRVCLKYEEHLK